MTSTVTTIPTLPPTPQPNNNSRGDDDMDISSSGFFFTIWILGMLIFIMLPFIGNKRRRLICRMRLKERRWNVGLSPDETMRRIMTPAAERRQRMAQQRRQRFELSKTQEDEIRQQFLKSSMQDYTMELEEDDIFKTDEIKDNHSNHSGRSILNLLGLSPNNNSSNNQATSTRRFSFGATHNKPKSGNPNSNDGVDDALQQSQSCDVPDSSVIVSSTTETTDTDGDADELRPSTSMPTESSTSFGPEQTVPISNCNDDNNDGDDETPPVLEIPLGHDDEVAPMKGEPTVRRQRADSVDSCDEMLEETFDPTEAPDDTDEMLRVPLAGQTKPSPDNQKDAFVTTTTRRNVPNGCAICIAPLEAGDNVTWSSNKQCSHIFHESCIMHWLLTVGRKTARKRRRQNNQAVGEDELEKICQFPMECPCCRQDFIVLPDTDDSSEDLKEPSETSATS